MNQKELYTWYRHRFYNRKDCHIRWNNEVVFSDYERHFANIQETLSDYVGRAAIHKFGHLSMFHRSLPVPAD